MKQSQVRLLVGAMILLIVITAMLYFQNDLRKFITGTKTTTPEPTNSIVIKPSDPVRAERHIRSVSFIEGYALSIQNEQTIVNTLEKEHIFGRKYVTDGKTTTGMKELSEIHLILRDKIPANTPDYGNNIYVYFGPGLIQVHFVVEKNRLTSVDKDAMLKNFINAIYRSVYTTATQQEANSETDKIYKALKEKNTTYIDIAEK